MNDAERVDRRIVPRAGPSATTHTGTTPYAAATTATPGITPSMLPRSPHGHRAYGRHDRRSFLLLRYCISPSMAAAELAHTPPPGPPMPQSEGNGLHPLFAELYRRDTAAVSRALGRAYLAAWARI